MNDSNQNPNGIMVISTEDTAMISKWKHLVSGVGFATGVVYAFHENTGFWKGLAISLIGGFTGAVLGHAIDHFSEK